MEKYLLIVPILYLCFLNPSPLFAQVTITETEWKGVGCFKIETPMGIVYFVKDNGVSGFKSFIDKQGNDWIASYLPPGPHGEYRGFPNAPGNFGHAGRDSNSKKIVVDNKMNGNPVISESWNDDFRFQYWFFTTHIAIKVLQCTGDYHFLYEGVPGGTPDESDYFVTPDGKKHIPEIEGEFDDFSPEWFYIGDMNSKNYLFLAKSPDDAAPNENHRQIEAGQHNMELYSFGRTGMEHRYKTYGMNGNEHICVIGFIDSDKNHSEIKNSLRLFWQTLLS